MSRSIHKRGILPTLRLAIRNPRALLKAPVTSTADAFDLARQVDTAVVVELAYLDIPSPNALHGNRYQASPTVEVTELLARLPTHDNFTFIDIGSGKGRVLLLAAEFPFRKIVGVEFSPELHATAQRNLTRLRAAGH
jgi:hypothetical protein